MSEIPECPHCQSKLEKWTPPEDSTWDREFFWVCFNDDCKYFMGGWAHMMDTQNIKASYRYKLDPVNGSSGPLPCWDDSAHKDNILKD